MDLTPIICLAALLAAYALTSLVACTLSKGVTDADLIEVQLHSAKGLLIATLSFLVLAAVFWVINVT